MKQLLLVLFCMMPLFTYAEDMDENPFGSDDDALIEVTTDTTQTVSVSSDQKDDDELPFWYGYVQWQKEVHEILSKHIESLKSEMTFGRLLVILIISFLYSILHTAGPGHGKVILGTYFLTSTENHKKRDALKAGIVVSLTHIGSALLLALFMLIVLRSMTQGAQDSEVTDKAKFMGGIMVMVTGVLIFLTSIFHEQMEKLEEKLSTMGPKNKSLIWHSILSGIVPCPLALFVLSLSIAAELFYVGLLSAFVMAIGAALTVGSIGYLAIRGREMIEKMLHVEKVKNMGMILRGGGALLLIFFGFVMMDLLG